VYLALTPDGIDKLYSYAGEQEFPYAETGGGIKIDLLALIGKEPGINSSSLMKSKKFQGRGQDKVRRILNGLIANDYVTAELELPPGRTSPKVVSPPHESVYDTHSLRMHEIDLVRDIQQAVNLEDLFRHNPRRRF